MSKCGQAPGFRQVLENADLTADLAADVMIYDTDPL